MTLTASSLSPSLWRRVQRQSFTSVDALAEFLELSEDQREKLSFRRKFPLLVPRRLAAKMEKRTLEDPLFRQFVPLVDEERLVLGFGLDPVGDAVSQKTPRLLHKYSGRVLLVCTSACAMHCRYCFRQEFDYAQGASDFEEELEYIRKEQSIREVILSGGDPLSLDDRILGKLLSELAQISHLKRVRFHTRFPLGIPERIDHSLLKILEECSLQIWWVLHCNHPRELDEDVAEALSRVARQGIPLLNQSVLLKGVNDSVRVQKELCERLVDSGIQPYYLHQLDRVQGAAHHEVEEAQGKALIQELSQQISGYAVPRYVQEISGEPHKTLVL